MYTYIFFMVSICEHLPSSSSKQNKARQLGRGFRHRRKPTYRSYQRRPSPAKPKRPRLYNGPGVFINLRGRTRAAA